MKNWNVGAAISCALRSISVTRMVEASDVSLTSEMRVFDSGGTATRVAWGSTTRRSVVLRLIPTVIAASHCPRGTARIAARTASEA